MECLWPSRERSWIRNACLMSSEDLEICTHPGRVSANRTRCEPQFHHYPCSWTEALRICRWSPTFFRWSTRHLDAVWHYKPENHWPRGAIEYRITEGAEYHGITLPNVRSKKEFLHEVETSSTSGAHWSNEWAQIYHFGTLGKKAIYIFVQL